MKARVLVVDDDHLVADTLSLIFNANGYECEATYSAADAFERVRSFEPAALLCDVMLPGETGLELAERIRQHMPETRMLLLSAYAGTFAMTQGPASVNMPAVKLLSKPCRPDDLLREMRMLLTA